MTEQYNDQVNKGMSSMASLFGNYKVDTRSERQKFMDEAFERINLERKGTKYPKVTQKRIALIVNFICPKVGGDSLIIDTRKACNESKKGYNCAFFGIYNKAQPQRKS